MATQDLIGKTTQSAVPPARITTANERRSTRRCKITQLMRIRPSDPERDNFEDLRGSMSVSRTGVYFQTSEAAYELGMRLFVTMPYTQGAMAMSHEYLAEVVRVEPMANGMIGIGFKMLMEMGSVSTHSYGVSVSRK
jgi:hypothetical protein